MTGGSKVRDIDEQQQAFKKDHGNVSVISVLIHFGTSHLPRDNPEDVANKICRLMIHTSKEFPNTSTYLSAILHKFGRIFNSMKSYVNNEDFNVCLDNQKMGIYTAQ